MSAAEEMQEIDRRLTTHWPHGWMYDLLTACFLCGYRHGLRAGDWLADRVFGPETD